MKLIVTCCAAVLLAACGDGRREPETVSLPVVVQGGWVGLADEADPRRRRGFLTIGPDLVVAGVDEEVRVGRPVGPGLDPVTGAGRFSLEDAVEYTVMVTQQAASFAGGEPRTCLEVSRRFLVGGERRPALRLWRDGDVAAALTRPRPLQPRALGSPPDHPVKSEIVSRDRVFLARVGSEAADFLPQAEGLVRARNGGMDQAALDERMRKAAKQNRYGLLQAQFALHRSGDQAALAAIEARRLGIELFTQAAETWLAAP